MCTIQCVDELTNSIVRNLSQRDQRHLSVFLISYGCYSTMLRYSATLISVGCVCVHILENYFTAELAVY